MGPEEERVFWTEFFKKNKCCKLPFFCRRIHERFENNPEGIVAQMSFNGLINFWSGGNDGDAGESGTTIRNEHQNARFSSVVRGKRAGGGGCPKGIRVITSAFARTIRDDHRAQWGARRPKHAVAKAILLFVWFRNVLFCLWGMRCACGGCARVSHTRICLFVCLFVGGARVCGGCARVSLVTKQLIESTAMKHLKDTARKLVKSRCRKRRAGVTQLPLGTARTGKAQYVNRMAKAERERRMRELALSSGSSNAKRFKMAAGAWQSLRNSLAEDPLCVCFFCAFVFQGLDRDSPMDAKKVLRNACV